MTSKKWNVLGFVALSATVLSAMGGCQQGDNAASSAQSDLPGPATESAPKTTFLEIRALKDTQIRSSSTGIFHKASVCANILKDTVIRFSSFIMDDRGIFVMKKEGNSYVFLEMKVPVETSMTNPPDRTAGAAISRSDRTASVMDTSKSIQGILLPDGTLDPNFADCQIEGQSDQTIIVNSDDYQIKLDNGWVNLKNLPSNKIP